MTDIRKIITQKLREQGRTMTWLSRKLGKSHAYIQQFIERGSPRDLRPEQKILVAELLGMNPEEVGLSEKVLRLYKTTKSSGAMSENDAAPYQPSPNSALIQSSTFAYYQVKSDALSRHPLEIKVGDILIFDISQKAVDNVSSEQIVLAQLYDKENLLSARTVLRQYIKPGMLITNRDTDNEAIGMSDDTLPFEPQIKGVFRQLVRE